MNNPAYLKSRSKAQSAVIALVMTCFLAVAFSAVFMVAPQNLISSSFGVETAHATTYELSEKKVTIAVGDSTSIFMSGTNTSQDKKVKWSSSNSAVAKVKKIKKGYYQCKVTGVGTGSCKVRAVLNGKSYTCKVTVKKLIFKADRTAVSVGVGKRVAVNVTYSGSGTVSFKADNSAVVDVEWGKKWSGKTVKLYITGVSSGSAVIKLTNKQTSDSFVIKVNVGDGSGNAVESIMSAIENSPGSFKNSSGNYVLKTVDELEHTTNTSAVIADRSKNCLDFVYKLESGNSTTYVEMTCGSSPYVSVDALSTIGSVKFDGTTTFAKAEYDGGYGFTWSIDSYSGYASTQSQVKVCGSALRAAMSGWDYLLGITIDRSMGDLGFVGV